MTTSKHGLSIRTQIAQLEAQLSRMPKPPFGWWLQVSDDEEDWTDADRRYVAMDQARKAIMDQIDALSPSRAARRQAA